MLNAIVIESLPTSRLVDLVERLSFRVDRLPVDPFECNESLSRRLLQIVRDELWRRM